MPNSLPNAVAAHPERIAAVCGQASLSYRELDERASRIAGALLEAGAKPDTLVALLAERGLPLLTMMVAVFKAGAAYLPLDVNHPAQRLQDVLKQSQAPVLLTACAGSDAVGAVLDEVLTGLEAMASGAERRVAVGTGTRAGSTGHRLTPGSGLRDLHLRLHGHTERRHG